MKIRYSFIREFKLDFERFANCFISPPIVPFVVYFIRVALDAATGVVRSGDLAVFTGGAEREAVPALILPPAAP